MYVDLNNNVPLLSVIIPVYNTSQYLRKCLDSVLSQTYRNIEVIIVDDASPDNSCQITKEYQEKDTRIRCITHNKNMGLFHARLSGIQESKGEYIAHLDSDDYVSVDFYRALICGIQKEMADIAIGNTVEVYEENNQLYCNYAHSNIEFNALEKDDILLSYFKQEGRNYLWHVIWNKIYTRELWLKALPYLIEQEKHLIMTEDFVFVTLLIFFSKRVVRVKSDACFYCRHGNASTAVSNLTFEKKRKNIEDLITAFTFVKGFMVSNGYFDKYGKDFINWQILYKGYYTQYIRDMKCKLNEKNKLYALLDLFYKGEGEIRSPYYFYALFTAWDRRYTEVKRAIQNPEIKVVSFDVFDTLVVRPFLRPTDLFLLLDDDFRRLTGGKSVVDFYVLRTESEKRTRELLSKKHNGFEDITLDEIYERMGEDYEISCEILKQMKQLEIEAELRFCKVRESALELYELAMHLEKKVICISDMYLPKKTIETILIRNGYTGINKIYVSSETRSSKCGRMFSFVVSELKLKPEEILHVGDNYDADFVKAKDFGLRAIHFIKTQDAFFDPAISGNLGQVFTRPLPFWQSNRSSLNFLGIRVMVSLIANRYFDNPYRTFNRSTDFNADPELIGYGAVGMYLFGVVTWLINNLKEKQYDKILFVARDGYLPMEAYKILKPFYNDLPQEEYLYMSRQAMILLSVQDDLDIYKLHEIIVFHEKTPNDIIPFLKVIFDIEENKLIKICKEEKIDLKANFASIGHYHRFITICRDNFFNREKHREKLDKLRRYFSKRLEGNVCIFDIGYSAKPELYLSKLCGKSIDTYFINLWCDDGFKHAQEGNFMLKTFLNCEPAIHGFIDELLFSKMEGSCIGYNIEVDAVEPVIEEYNLSYPEFFVTKGIQESALCFIYDLATIFKADIHKLYIQSNYTSLLFCLLFFSSKETDKNIFSCFAFEDNIGTTQTGSLLYRWNCAIGWANQHQLDELYSYTPTIAFQNLEGYSKAVKFFYWFFFNRELLKVKIKERFKEHKIMLTFLKFTYGVLKKIKRIMNGKGVR